jgi:hypothetical protein
MPTAPTRPPPPTLRRRLAALRPGRPIAIACVIAIALAAADQSGPTPPPRTLPATPHTAITETDPPQRGATGTGTSGPDARPVSR